MGLLRDKFAGLSSFLGTAVKVGAAAAAAGMIGLGVSAVKAASDFGESLSKVRVVFRDSAGEIEKFTKTAARELGLSQRAALEAAGTFGNLFVAMKIGQPQAAAMSQGILKLAADLASFNNIPVDIALEKLRAGLVGEVEPLRTLGVNLSAVAVGQRAVAMGLSTTTENLAPAIKAQAAYSLIMEQTKTAQGDFARTSDGLANRTRILTASFDDLKVTLGQKLQPVVDRVLGTIVNTVQSPAFQNGVRDWTAAIGQFVQDVGAGFGQTVIPSFKWIVNNKAALVTAIVALGAAFVWINPVAAGLAGIIWALQQIGKSSVQGLTGTALDRRRQIQAVLAANPNMPDWARTELEKELKSGMGAAAAEIGAAADAALAKLRPLKEEVQAFGTGATGAKEKVLTLKEALEDLTITMSEAAELKLTPAAAGAAEAMALLGDETMKANERTFNLTKTISGLQSAAQIGESIFGRFLKKLVDGALELSRAAASAIFGRPTKEEAALELQIAEVDRMIAGFRASALLAGGDVEKATKPYQVLRDKLQAQLDLMTAENRIQQLRLQLADQTLLSEQEQYKMTIDLIEQIRTLSGLARETSERLGLSMIPAFDEARRAALDLAAALRMAAGSSSTGGIITMQGGTDYVPRNMLAYLHRGERVVPASENIASLATPVVNLTVYGSILSERDIVRVVRDAILGGGFRGVIGAV